MAIIWISIPPRTYYWLYESFASDFYFLITVICGKQLIFLSHFQLRVVAYDNTTPNQRATADVAITMLRNINSPIFAPDNYIETIPEETAVGTAILRVTASDADNVRKLQT